MIFSSSEDSPDSLSVSCKVIKSLAGLPARSAFWLRRQLLVRPSFRLHPRLKPVAL
jgi:hypothetical protein